MTDELLIEILQKHDSVHSGPMLIKDIIAAMREAVEKGSIGFGEWMCKNYNGFMGTDRYMKSLTKDDFDKTESWPYIETIQTFTTEQLYKLYQSKL